MKTYALKLPAALLLAVPLIQQASKAADRHAWRQGHGDLAVNHIDGAWKFSATVDGAPIPEYAPNALAVTLGDSSRTAIPNNPNFAFLGGVGDPIWIAPQSQAFGVPFVGVSAQSTALGTFANNRFNLLLTHLVGPGDFTMWTTGGVGAPTVRMNSRDGITPGDMFEVPSGGHTHVNWGFSSPGTYSIGFTASGTLAGSGQPTTSEETGYLFEVGVLKAGEVDIEIAYEEGGLEFHAHDETTDTEHSPAHVALHAGPSAWQTVPEDSAFAFLGNAGDSIHVLPQDENANALFLGLAAGEVPSGVFVGDTLKVQLTEFSGPGDFFSYAVDPFGVPTVSFNTADGIDPADAATLASGSHSHRNWAFTAPGIYRVTLSATGELTGGGIVASEPTMFLFEVFGPEVFDRGEIDLEIAYENGVFELALLDDAAEQEYGAADAVLVARAPASTTVPTAPEFSFLGNPGAVVHILPQDETENLLFLGIAADEIAAGEFVGESVQLRLASLEGPGHLALYSTDGFGAPTLYWNSSDGLTDADSYPAAVGSHAHNNWAFTKPGIYQVGLKVVGRLAADNQPVESEAVIFTFQVKAPARFESGELDFEIAYADGGWELAFLDEAAEREYETDEALLVAVPAAIQTVPNDPAFAFLGSPGAATHVLPQEETGGVLFLGIAGDEIEPGLFAGGKVELRLVSAAGPGKFALYGVDAFGEPTVFMNTADGISGADSYPVAVGSHTHLNWAFSSPGEYRLTFKSVGTLAAGATPTESGPATLSFLIQAAGPAIAASLINNGADLEITWASESGKNYQLQSSLQLGSGDWSNEATPRVGNGSALSVTVPATGDALKVFRIVVTP